MIKICFVCLGNICRSPMAEFIMKDLIVKNNLINSIYITSRATSYEEIGNSIYQPAKDKLKEHHIYFDNNKKATKNGTITILKTVNLFGKFIFFIC